MNPKRYHEVVCTRNRNLLVVESYVAGKFEIPEAAVIRVPISLSCCGVVLMFILQIYQHLFLKRNLVVCTHVNCSRYPDECERYLPSKLDLNSI